MEIITIECPKCKGELHIKADTEKLFCMYCRSEVMVKEAASSGSVTLDSLVKRGFLALDYAEWDRAVDSFDQATHINPEHAMIYVGKLMAELKLKEEANLGKHHDELTGYVNYQKAIRFADGDLKKRLESYNEQIVEKARAEKEQERLAHQKKLEEDEERKKSELIQQKLEHERVTRLEGERLQAKEVKQKRVRYILIIIASVIFLIFIVGTVIRNVQDRAEEQRIVAEREARAQRLEEERLAEEQRLLEEAEINRQVVWNSIEARIEEGYSHWLELVEWTIYQDIPWSISVNGVRPNQDLIDNVNKYGIIGEYIKSEPEIEFREDSEEEAVLLLHFESLTYRKVPAELSQLDNDSESDLSIWLEDGGIERARLEFYDVRIISTDQNGNEIIGEVEFGKEFISWFFEIDRLESFENTFLHIIRTYQVFEPTVEQLQQSILQLTLARIEQMDYSEYPTAFIGERLAQGSDLSAFSEWLNLEEIVVDEGVLSLILRDIDVRGNRLSGGDRNRLSRPLGEENFLRWTFEYEFIESERFEDDILVMTVSRFYDVIVTGLTLENFTEIQEDMTLEQVALLLGSEGTISSASGSLETRSWQSGTRIVIITFRNGVVTGKSQSGL